MFEKIKKLFHLHCWVEVKHDSYYYLTECSKCGERKAENLQLGGGIVHLAVEKRVAQWLKERKPRLRRIRGNKEWKPKKISKYTNVAKM